MRYDFTYVQALQSAARRERAEAVYELIVLPIVSLVRALRDVHHERPRLARQG